ncbi:peptidase inhibitor family I36 protein [Streptomyces sp. NPDC001890]|uniref:peptidase inhibitor family I36 protein n=1 Tax=Streptomyces sp. NPDC001890 TaxID=3364620 RepID=UPI0036B42683
MLATITRRMAMVLTAAITLIPLTATESAAASCPANNFCLWEDGPSSSRMARFVNGADDTGRAGLPDGGETMQNRTQTDWCVWSNRNYGGTKKVVHPGEFVSFGKFTVFSLLPETTWRCVT